MTEKAYKNQEFMLGLEARPLRVLAEYIEPRDRLSRYGVDKAIIFFGSARTIQDKPTKSSKIDYYFAAHDLAKRLAQWTTDKHVDKERYVICSGGGPGIMEAANRGAMEANPALSMGLNISLPFEQSSNQYIDERLNFEFHYFFMRKFWFVNLAHAMAIFPGGYGTMDELFEVMTLVQTGKKQKMPIVLYGKDFWNSLVNFQQFVDLELISPEDLELFKLCDSVEEAYEFLTANIEAVAEEKPDRP